MEGSFAKLKRTETDRDWSNPGKEFPMGMAIDPTKTMPPDMMERQAQARFDGAMSGAGDMMPDKEGMRGSSEAMMIEVDTNGNGQVDPQEIKAFLGEKLGELGDLLERLMDVVAGGGGGQGGGAQGASGGGSKGGGAKAGGSDGGGGQAQDAGKPEGTPGGGQPDGAGKPEGTPGGQGGGQPQEAQGGGQPQAAKGGEQADTVGSAEPTEAAAEAQEPMSELTEVITEIKELLTEISSMIRQLGGMLGGGSDSAAPAGDVGGQVEAASDQAANLASRSITEEEGPRFRAEVGQLVAEVSEIADKVQAFAEDFL